MSCEQFSPKSAGTSDNKNLSVKCCFCKSQNFIKWGKRKTEHRGLIQTYKCRYCNKRFTNDEGFYRMRNPQDKITQAIDLYFSNLSSRKVRNHFRRHRPDNCSHITVLDWCRRYVLKVTNYINTLQPQLSGKFYADETEIDCERRNDIFWVNVDWDTRYINATHYNTYTQDLEEATEFMKKIRQSKRLPKYIQTDAGRFYPTAFTSVFYSRYKEHRVEHKVINHSKTGKYNVRIETVFMKVKDRVDDFRGLKALWSAPILLQGIILQHNFIEAHTTTGQVPSELAGLKMELGVNRWLGLVRLSCFNNK